MIDLTQIAFGFFALIVLAGGIMLAMTRKLVHALFLFFMTLMGIAALFVLGNAEFLAVSHIMIYVGGILIVLMFGILLTRKLRGTGAETEIVNIGPGLGVAAGIAAFMLWMIEYLPPQVAGEACDTNTEIIGREMLTHFLLPFELVSVLLLVALIGAIYIARKDRKEDTA